MKFVCPETVLLCLRVDFSRTLISLSFDALRRIGLLRKLTLQDYDIAIDVSLALLCLNISILGKAMV